MGWVLIEELSSKKLRKPIYFKEMVHIGPCATDNLEDAAKFASLQEARMSPAYIHSLSCYEPLEIKDTA